MLHGVSTMSTLSTAISFSVRRIRSSALELSSCSMTSMGTFLPYFFSISPPALFTSSIQRR